MQCQMFCNCKTCEESNPTYLYLNATQQKKSWFYFVIHLWGYTNYERCFGKTYFFNRLFSKKSNISKIYVSTFAAKVKPYLFPQKILNYKCVEIRYHQNLINPLGIYGEKGPGTQVVQGICVFKKYICKFRSKCAADLYETVSIVCCS